MEVLESATKIENSFKHKRDFNLMNSMDINLEAQEEAMIFMAMDEVKCLKRAVF